MDMWDDADFQETCDHVFELGRVRKFDGGRCPLLCGECYLILGYWEVAEGGTLLEGPYKYVEYLCTEHYHCGEPMEYVVTQAEELELNGLTPAPGQGTLDL